MQSEKHPMAHEAFKAHMRMLATGIKHPPETALYFVVDTYNSFVRMPSSAVFSQGRYITLVIQHRYWDLQVTGDTMHVTMTFNREPHRLSIPFDAVVHSYYIGEPLREGIEYRSKEFYAMREKLVDSLPQPAAAEGANVVRVDFQARRRV